MKVHSIHFKSVFSSQRLLILSVPFLFFNVKDAQASLTCGEVFLSSPQWLSMDARYAGENKGLYVDPITKKPWNVHYFSEKELGPLTMQINQGIFLNSQGRKVDSEFDSESISFEQSLFVIDKQGRLLNLPYEQRGKYHHSSLSQGSEVLFAGMAAFHQGYLRELSDSSGHYKPTARQTLEALYYLRSRGVNMNYLHLTGRLAQDLNGQFSIGPQELQKIWNGK